MNTATNTAAAKLTDTAARVLRYLSMREVDERIAFAADICAALDLTASAAYGACIELESRSMVRWWASTNTVPGGWSVT